MPRTQRSEEWLNVSAVSRLNGGEEFSQLENLRSYLVGVLKDTKANSRETTLGEIPKGSLGHEV